ncbi:hypothetical protein BKA66DRAFT_447637 [Pyrenochaeta sp. MPI-SDFR-AT-0127]|nr:hypothetical protein BKA66DRAFT_447637 [Pyrenochaeta sp. MPI-SDFR-AT-0127]
MLTIHTGVAVSKQRSSVLCKATHAPGLHSAVLPARRCQGWKLQNRPKQPTAANSRPAPCASLLASERGLSWQSSTWSPTRDSDAAASWGKTYSRHQTSISTQTTLDEGSQHTTGSDLNRGMSFFGLGFGGREGQMQSALGSIVKPKVSAATTDGRRQPLRRISECHAKKGVLTMPGGTDEPTLDFNAALACERYLRHGLWSTGYSYMNSLTASSILAVSIALTHGVEGSSG